MPKDKLQNDYIGICGVVRSWCKNSKGYGWLYRSFLHFLYTTLYLEQTKHLHPKSPFHYNKITLKQHFEHTMHRSKGVQTENLMDITEPESSQNLYSSCTSLCSKNYTRPACKTTH